MSGRSHGEVLKFRGRVLRSPSRFHRAIEVARRQDAGSLELRAVMSLSRLWRLQGRSAEACAMLAAVYDWFSEGFDTADLREARALSEALA